MDNRILTVKDVAAYLKVTQRTIYRLIQERKMPSFRVGGSWRFQQAELEKWIQMQTHVPSFGVDSQPMQSRESTC